MSRNKAMQLSDVPLCPTAVTAFYDRFRERITAIKTIEQRNNILSDMQQSDEYWEAVVDYTRR